MPGKFARLTSILVFMKARGKVTARELAKEFEVSERTIARDMEQLLTKGIPLISEAGPGGGYSLPPEISIEPDMFTVEETIVLSTGSTAIQMFSDFWETPLTTSTVNAKLLAVLSDAEKELVSKHLDYIYFDRSRWYRIYSSQKALQILKTAVIYDRQVLVEYFDRDEDMETQSPKTSLIDPYGLVFKSDTWYLGGFCHALNRMKRWNITRIVDAKLTQGKFQRPKNFVLQAWWEQGLEEFGKGKIRVCLVINKQAWYRFRRFKWKAEDQIETHENHVVVYMYVDKFEWLVDLVLVNRGDVFVIEPEELRERIANIAHRLYRGSLAVGSFVEGEVGAVDFEILSSVSVK